MGLTNFLSSIPVVGGLFDDSEQQALDQLAQNKDLFNAIQLPTLNDYKPEDYQVAGTYDPLQAQATTVSENPEDRSMQMAALNRMAGLADTGLSDVDNAGFERARSMANQISNSGTAAALQNAQARGVAGSGLEFALREQAGQDAATRAQQAGLDQAAASAQQRALYNQAFGNATSQMRAQDLQPQMANANILNQFAQYNTGAQNQAQQYNLQNAQDVANQNTTQANYAQQYNNQMAQQNFQNQMQKAGAQAGANTGMAQGYAAQNAANTDARNANTQLGASILGMPAGVGGGKRKNTDIQPV